MQSSDKFQVEEFYRLTDFLARRIAAIHPVTTVYKLLLKTDVNSDKYAALKATNTKKLSDVALKNPKNYNITERFCCIKIMSEKHGLL